MHVLATDALTGNQQAAENLKRSGALMGLLQQPPTTWFQGTEDTTDIDAAIQARLAARKAKDFTRADEIRAEWLAKGILFEDGPTGTRWSRK